MRQYVHPFRELRHKQGGKVNGLGNQKLFAFPSLLVMPLAWRENPFANSLLDYMAR